jgi:hypothetical protein
MFLLVSYFVISVLFFLVWFVKIANHTNNLEERVYLQYCAVIWCVFWPVTLLVDLLSLGKRR